MEPWCTCLSTSVARGGLLIVPGVGVAPALPAVRTGEESVGWGYFMMASDQHQLASSRATAVLAITGFLDRASKPAHR